MYSGASEGEEEEEDAVVAEFDVYLNRSLEDMAYVLRWPNHAAARPVPKVTVARMKPGADLLEVEYDTLKAVGGQNKHAHFDVGGKSSLDEKQEKDLEESLRIQTVRSKRISCQERAYCMGFVNKESKTVHLVPLKGIYEMNPILQSGFVDPTEGGVPLEASAADKASSSSSSAPTTAAKPKSSPRLLDVVNYRKDSARAALEATRLTFSKMKQIESEEQWVQLRVFSRDSEHTKLMYQKHMPDPNDPRWLIDELSDISESSSSEESSSEDDEDTAEAAAKRLRKRRLKKRGVLSTAEAFRVSRREFLDRIAPPIRVESMAGVVEIDAQGNPIGVGGTHRISVEEGVTQRLTRGHVLRFEELVPPGGKNKREVVQTLLGIAVLVRGVWALGSEEFYKDQMGEVFSDGVDRSQENIKKRCAIRDVVLGVFEKSETPMIDKSQITRLVKVPSSTLHDAITSVAKIDKKNSKHWVLFAQDDPKFQKQYPKVCAQQKELWKKRFFDALVYLGVSADKAMDESGYDFGTDLPPSRVKLEPFRA